MRTSQVVLFTAVAAASLATASPAGAAPALDPGAFGSARKGSLLVSSSVLVSFVIRAADIGLACPPAHGGRAATTS